MPYESLLPYRPTNAMHQLGAGSNVPLLNGRHILDTLAQRACVLWAPGIAHESMVPAVIRAAAHEKAVVGLALAPGSADPEVLKRGLAPGAFFSAAVRAAAEVTGAAPFMLHVQAPPLDRSDGAGFEAVRDYLASCVDVGFSSYGVDLTRCDPAQAAEVATSLLEPVFHLELGVVVHLPAGGVEVSVATLKKNGVDPDLIVLPGPEELGEEAWDLAANVAPLVAPAGIGWADGRPVSEALPGAEATAARFVRALVGGHRFSGMALGPDGEIDESKAEALAYMEASKVIRQLGGRGTAPWLEQALQP